MNRLQKRKIGPFSRKFSLNSSLFASNLRKNGHDFSLFRYDPHKARQTPSFRVAMTVTSFTMRLSAREAEQVFYMIQASQFG